MIFRKLLSSSSISLSSGQAKTIRRQMQSIECFINPDRHHHSKLSVTRWWKLSKIWSMNQLNALAWADQSFPKTLAETACLVCPWANSNIPRKNTSSPDMTARLSNVTRSGNLNRSTSFLKSARRKWKKMLQSDSLKELIVLSKEGHLTRTLRVMRVRLMIPGERNDSVPRFLNDYRKLMENQHIPHSLKILI